MGSDDGTFLQEYFVYCKKKFLNQGANCPSDAADELCGVALRITLSEFSEFGQFAAK